MKTLNFKSLSFFILMILAGLIFFSCESTELVTPEEKEYAETTDAGLNTPDLKLHYQTDKSVMASLDEVGLTGEVKTDVPIKDFTIYQYIEFNVRTMATKYEELPEKVEDPVLIHDAFITKDRYMLIGEGSGWCEQMGRSTVTTKLEFSPETCSMKGEVMCEFYPSGDILKLTLEGCGPFKTMEEFDGPNQVLELKATMEHISGCCLKTEEIATSYFLNADVLMKPGLEHFSTYLITKGKMFE